MSWTANAVTGSTIGHGLGVKPNMIILKTHRGGKLLKQGISFGL